MALVRCPRCRLDTSDALASCPNCGAGFHGPDRGAVAVAVPIAEPSSQPAGRIEPSPVKRPVAGGPAGRSFGAVVSTVLLVLLVGLFATGRISSFAWFVLIVIWFVSRNGLQSAKRMHGEALRALLANRAAVTRGGASDKPLEILQRIEREMRKRSETDRPETGEGS